MTDARIISVNPAEKSLGEKLLNQKCLGTISKCISDSSRIGLTIGRCVNLFFGLNGKINLQLSSKLLFLRLVAGAVLICSVLLPVQSVDLLSFGFEPQNMFIIAFAFSLVFGFFTRVCSIAALGWYGYLLYSSIAASAPDVSLLPVMGVGVMFWILGPGMFSFDQLVRCGLMAVRNSIKRSAGKSSRPTTLDYRAYSTVESRLA